MFQHRLLALAVTAAMLGMTGCNSNDHDNPQTNSKPVVQMTTITVTPSLGKILNARVMLRSARTGKLLAPIRTLTPADNGIAKITVPVSTLSEPVVAAILPTPTGVVEYVDEAIQGQTTTINVPPAQVEQPILRVAASVLPNANVGVTALTEAAVQKAEQAAGGLTAQNINQANAAVRNQLDLNFDITQAPVVVGLGEFEKLIDAALDAQRRAYAAYLATLAAEAKRINPASLTPAFDIARAFADDFAHDGTFNAVGSQPLALDYNLAFISAWLHWVDNFYTKLIEFTTIGAFNQWYTGFNAEHPNQNNTTPPPPLRVVDGVAEYPCTAEGLIKSGTGTTIDFNFVNQRSDAINVFWLDQTGARQTYKLGLANGQTHIQQTFVTHPWIVTGAQGQCLGIFKPVTATTKTVTFKNNRAVIGVEVQNPPGTVKPGLVGNYSLRYQQIATGGPYSNGQQVPAIVGSDNSLTIDGKKLINPFLKTVSPAEIFWKDGNLEYALSNNTTGVFNEINLSVDGTFRGQFTAAVTVDSCQKHDLPSTTVSSLTTAGLTGQYNVTLSNGSTTLNIAANGTAELDGTISPFIELCGPNVQSNGTNFYLITQKGNIALFKDNSNVITAEGPDFSNGSGSFFGTKSTSGGPNNAGSMSVSGGTSGAFDFSQLISINAADNTTIYNYSNLQGAGLQMRTFADSNQIASVTLSVGTDAWSITCPQSGCTAGSISFNSSANVWTISNLDLNPLTGKPVVMLNSTRLQRLKTSGSLTSTIGGSLNTSFTPSTLTVNYNVNNLRVLTLSSALDANNQTAVMIVNAFGDTIQMVSYTASRPGLTMTYGCNNEVVGKACESAISLSQNAATLTFDSADLPFVQSSSGVAPPSITMNGILNGH